MSSKPPSRSIHARNLAEWRAWLRANGRAADEIWLIFYKKNSGKPSIDFVDALDEALCFGWVDTRVKSLDAQRYMQRFAPRKPDSTWSSINVARAKRLIDQGRMTAAGHAAFEGHESRRTPLLPTKLPSVLARTFKKNRSAWSSFQSFPPGYRRMSIGWVASAKRPETRAKRLAKLMDYSARNKRLEFI